MSVKISELPSASSVTSSDVVPIVQGGTTKQANLGIVASAGGVPTGSIMQYDGNTIPAGYEEVNGYDNYSTTEHVVGTWIDGKPLYEKTIHYSGSMSTSTAFPHNVTNISSAFLVSGFIPYGASEFYQIGTYQDANRFISCPDISATNILINIGSGWSSSFTNGCILTIRYTKTTDSAS